MSCRDILVVVDKPESIAARLAVAAAVARPFGARVSGVYATGFPLMAASGDVVASTALIESFMEAQQEEAAKAEAAYRSESARLRVSGEWLFRQADATETVVGLARLHDLVVLGQPDPGGSGVVVGLSPEEIVLAAGRPALVVPYAGVFATVGTNALVAWSGTRESARALHDALFLLERSERVTVIEVDPAENGGDRDAAAVAALLQRRGIAATAESVPSGEVPVADLLLSRAADLGADLLVMGAWGHSRVRELVLGGVSRSLFAEMTLPVLMSH